MRTMKHLAFAAMAASALALAGCGGGGSSSSMVAPTTPTTTTSETTTPTSMELLLPSGSNMYLDDSDTMLADGTFTVAAGTTVNRGAYAFTCGGDEDCTVTVADDVVTETGGVTVDYTATAQATITMKMMMADETNTEKAIGLSKALAAATEDDDNAPTVSRGTSGAATFKKAGFEAGAAPMSIAGWEGATLTQKTQSIVAYTEIEAATRMAFTKVYSATAADNPGGLAFADGMVTIPAAALSSSQAALLDKTRFPQKGSAGAGTETWTYVDEADVDVGEKMHPREFSGTLQGARGDYSCTGECSVAVTDAGSYTFAGTWNFDPDSSAQAVVTDPDYLTFGWWIDEKKKTAAGDYPFTVNTFATGSAVFPTAADTDTGAVGLDALTGEVEYNGVAAGLYAVKNVEGGEIVSAAHGAFTADASLTADFEAGDAGFLSGKIDGFQGGMDMSGWEVTLQKSNFDTDGSLADQDDATNATGMMVAGKIGDTKSTNGIWDVSLHGSGADAAAPSGIAGTFRVDFTNANIAGAFGATRDK